MADWLSNDAAETIILRIPGSRYDGDQDSPTYTPVSYTHLDVYKRQFQRSGSKIIEPQAAPAVFSSLRYPSAVAYISPYHSGSIPSSGGDPVEFGRNVPDP